MKNSTFSASVAAIMSLFLLSGCVTEDSQPNTVDWYKSHDTERREMLKTCSNNPAELNGKPDCINALAAERAMSIGKLK